MVAGGHGNYCASRIGKHKTTLARCIDGSTGDQSVEETNQVDRDKSIALLEKKYVQDVDKCLLVGGIVYHNQELWTIMGFFDPLTKDSIYKHI